MRVLLNREEAVDRAGIAYRPIDTDAPEFQKGAKDGEIRARPRPPGCDLGPPPVLRPTASGTILHYGFGYVGVFVLG